MIDETGKQLGVFPVEEALKMAMERDLDLVEITEKVIPPICKIIDYGKYLYQLGKKERGQKTKQKRVEVKGIRIRPATAKHDLELRAEQAKGFLEEGNKVKIEMVLRGREKAHQDLAKEKIKKLISLIPIDTVIEQEAKYPRGLMVIISKK